MYIQYVQHTKCVGVRVLCVILNHIERYKIISSRIYLKPMKFIEVLSDMFSDM